MDDLYDSDFYAWATTQAALLRARRLDQADPDRKPRSDLFFRIGMAVADG
jgi:hypothetical protein